ncbi:MAG TPA: hypothetical protein VF088_19235 [Pyrinomonadaceae bacterium]
MVTGGAATVLAPRLFGSSASGFAPLEDDPWRSVMPGILARIKPPVFPNRTFLITNYGARSDGLTNCTAAFQKAIAACSKAGGDL